MENKTSKLLQMT